MTFFGVDMFVWFFGVFVASWVVPKKYSPFAVAVVTAGFLVVHDPLSLSLLFGTTLVTYVVSGSKRSSSVAILALIAGVMLVLGWYKIQRVGGALFDMTLSGGAIPLGLSYYILRQVHYLFERYKGKLPPHGFGDYFCFLFFLPTLAAGPINLFSDFKRDTSRRRFDTAMTAQGLERILLGAVKVNVLGNYLVSFQLRLLLAPLSVSHPALYEYFDCLRYGLNLYFQFSGYSDAAIGVSAMMGYRIIENFNYPFLARNINDFWKRWHISLSEWCRSYVYTPTAAASRMPYLAILVTMLVLALWHEFSLRYALWGGYHGLGIALWQLFQRGKPKVAVFKVNGIRQATAFVSILFTMNFVILSFAFTKEPSISAAIGVLRKIFFGEG